MTFTDRSLSVDRYRAHYVEGGSGHPLLLIHGSGPGASTVGNWRRILEPLAVHYHVYAMDLIGFGLSDRKRTGPYFDIALWLRQCRALLDAMPGSSLGVIGHSLSGALALKLAGLEPRVSGVLTTACMGASFKLNPAVEMVWTFPRDREELRRTAELLIHDKTLIDTAYLDARTAVLHKDASYGPYFTAMFSGDKQTYVDQTVLSASDLAAVRCRVSMLHGRDDVGFPPAISLDIAARLPQADVLLLGQCSHSIAMEQTEKFLAAAKAIFPMRPAA